MLEAPHAFHHKAQRLALLDRKLDGEKRMASRHLDLHGARDFLRPRPLSPISAVSCPVAARVRAAGAAAATEREAAEGHPNGSVFHGLSFYSKWERHNTNGCAKAWHPVAARATLRRGGLRTSEHAEHAAHLHAAERPLAIVIMGTVFSGQGHLHLGHVCHAALPMTMAIEQFGSHRSATARRCVGARELRQKRSS